jgi:hypothetical protein
MATPLYDDKCTAKIADCGGDPEDNDFCVGYCSAPGATGPTCVNALLGTCLEQAAAQESSIGEAQCCVAYAVESSRYASKCQPRIDGCDGAGADEGFCLGYCAATGATGPGCESYPLNSCLESATANEQGWCCGTFPSETERYNERCQTKINACDDDGADDSFCAGYCPFANGTIASCPVHKLNHCFASFAASTDASFVAAQRGFCCGTERSDTAEYNEKCQGNVTACDGTDGNENFCVGYCVYDDGSSVGCANRKFSTCAAVVNEENTALAAACCGQNTIAVGEKYDEVCAPATSCAKFTGELEFCIPYCSYAYYAASTLDKREVPKWCTALTLAQTCLVDKTVAECCVELASAVTDETKEAYNLLCPKAESQATPAQGKSSKLGAGAIVGIVIAAIVVVGAVVAALVYFLVIHKAGDDEVAP